MLPQPDISHLYAPELHSNPKAGQRAIKLQQSSTSKDATKQNKRIAVKMSSTTAHSIVVKKWSWKSERSGNSLFSDKKN